MSVNQWKLLNQLREYLSKLNDKSAQAVVQKELQYIARRIPDLQRDVLRYFEHKETKTTTTTTPENVVQQNEEQPQQSNKYLPNVLVDTLKKKSDAPEAPRWKTTTAVVISKSSLLARTRHLIHLITTADSDFTLLKRLEDFIDFIKQYPEAKHVAVKEGAVRNLLKKRSKTSDENVQQSIREAFALLGHSPPLPAKGIRILSIDGGGIRGLLVIEMLKKLEESTGKRVHELFDFFCGVSTGAILAYLLAIHRKGLDEIAEGYKELSLRVFKQSALWGTSSLVWSHSYYDTALWEQLLREHLGEESLIRTARSSDCPKICTISAVVNQSKLSAYLFRNYSLPFKVQSYYIGGHDHKIWEAARASAAAPTYFEEFKLGSLLHQDGGIFVNNPTAIGLHEAKLLWPKSQVQCIVSFGTGRSVPSPADLAKETVSLNNTSWANKFLKILDSATDTEAVHTMLNDLLPDDVYYRFNPYLTEMLSMTEIDQKKIEMLHRDVIMYLRRNEDKFQAAAKTLMQDRSFYQKVGDYLGEKAEMYGLASVNKL